MDSLGLIKNLKHSSIRILAQVVIAPKQRLAALRELHSSSYRYLDDSDKHRIAREPSPILFGALHLTMNDTFDMNEIFRSLVQPEASSVSFSHYNRPTMLIS